MSYDPTRTNALRMALLRKIAIFLGKLDGEIRSWLLDPWAGITSNALEPDVLRKFEAWLDAKLKELMPKEELGEYTKKAYERGAEAAYKKATKAPLRGAKRVAENLLGFRSTLNNDNTLKKLQLLYTKNFSDLEGITQKMSKRISSIMAEGVLSQESNSSIAKRISEEVKGMTLKRARTLVNTEMVRAVAEGALDALENLGVKNIEVDVEWSTAGDGKVCPKCKALQGLVIAIKDAHGMFPRHPNCRCMPIPSVTRSPEREKTRDRIRRSIEAGLPTSTKRSFEAQKKMDKWQGKTLLK